MDKKGFTINMGVFVSPENVEIDGKNVRMGVTKKTSIPLFVDSDYNLGYIFGSFLACGIANLTDYRKSTRGITIFRAKPGLPHDFSKLKKVILEVFNLKARENENSLYVYNVPLTKLFYEFGIRKGRHLPEKYFVSHEGFNSGLLDGLEDFHALEEDPRTKRVVSLYVKKLYDKLTKK